MDIKRRLEILEDAHRALAAQHTALMTVCRFMLPLIPADPVLIMQLMTGAYDISNEHMSNAGQDAEYQANVREWLDVLSTAILASPHKSPGPENLSAG